MIDSTEIRRIVERSRAAQNLPTPCDDPATLAAVAAVVRVALRPTSTTTAKK
jgi:hypothetical protein